MGDSRRIVAQQFQSGFWFKQDLTFVNIRSVLADMTLAQRADLRVRSRPAREALRVAESGSFTGNGHWQLTDVQTTEITADGTRVTQGRHVDWETVLRPSLLTVYQVMPERLELNTLYDNIRVLGNQKTSRFEIAFWNKLFYPAAVMVMMILAMPFAYFQRRAGGIGFRIFAGTMLGLAFFLLGRLFSNLGVINDWQPLFSAVFPLAVFHRASRSRCCGGWSGARRRSALTAKKIPAHGRDFYWRWRARGATRCQAAPGTMLTNLRFSLPLVRNSTLPWTSANSVWSLPMPTLVPGWNGVPRWRTMMLPALMTSPPYDLTPRRFDSESRPLRELPPAFLCAMVIVSPSADDAFDLELGVVLAMALVLLVVLAPAHLEYGHLLAATMRDDGCLDGCAGDDRLTQTDAFAVTDHQHLIDDHFCAHVRRYLFYFEFFAGGNFVLLAAGFYDRVHEGNSVMISATIAEKP